jgi:hypothetical protein
MPDSRAGECIEEQKQQITIKAGEKLSPAFCSPYTPLCRLEKRGELS